MARSRRRRALLEGLIATAEKEGEARLSLTVSVHNPAAVRLYASLGFDAVGGEEEHPILTLDLASR